MSRAIFKLFASCLPVKGASVSIICDIQRSEFLYITDGMYDILTQHKNKTLPDIKDYYDHKIDSIIDEYFDLLVQKDYGHFTEDSDAFPDLDLAFETPEAINNAIVDIGSQSNHDYQKIFGELDAVGCKYLELRFFIQTPLAAIGKILEKCRRLRFRNVDLYIKFDEAFRDYRIFIDEIFSKFSFVGRIVIHSSPEDLVSKIDEIYVIYINQQIRDSTCCGYIALQTFSINLWFYAEAQKHNTCLNKKISIDEAGKIKNCPAMKYDFGTHHDISLAEVYKNSSFQKVWNINKDQINICKDCQFRYICSDCRAFVADIYDKPVKCGYDPYANVWRTEAVHES